MERVMDSYREMVLFHKVEAQTLIAILRDGIGEPNERDDIQKYFSKFYVFAKDGKLQDFQDLGILTERCKDILERYTVVSEE